MKNGELMSLIVIIIMAIVSISSLIGLNIAGTSVVIGVIFFFINKAIEKQPFKDSGLDIKAINTNLRDKKIWLWIVLPLIMNAVCIIIAVLFIPEYVRHVLARTESQISFERVLLLVLQLAVLALVEEIAWRAYFQNQLNKVLPKIPVLLITSVLFAIGHWATGNILVKVFDVFFIFINSILYGIVFNKTNNAWISAISHFIANIFAIAILLFI